MRAAVIDRAGAEPRFGDFPEPEPVAGESLSRIRAAGLHPLVRSLAAGAHYGSEGVYPLVPGIDGVGTASDGALRYLGFVRAPWGTFAERAATRLGIPLPPGADPEVIAGTLNPGMSSWLPLRSHVREGKDMGTVVVLGATGIAGRLAVQNAVALGAERVVGIGRDEARLADVRALGAQAVRLADGPSAIVSALDGASPSLILDFLWGSAAEQLWSALAAKGFDEKPGHTVHVEIGALAGASAALPAALLRSRAFTVRGSGAGSASLTEIMAELPVYMERVARSEVSAPIEVFPLSRIAEAWAYRGPRRVVVVPD